MRMAVFSDTYLPQINGVSKTLGRMREYMNHSGIDSVFITPAAPEGEADILVLPGLRFFLYPELSLALPRYLYICRTLDAFRPQLIHLATEFTAGLLGLKYALTRGIPVTASYHTNFPEYLRYYHLQALQGAAWKYLVWFHSYMRVNFCPSQDTAQHLARKGIPRLEVMGRGIDDEGFSPLLRSHEVRRGWKVPDDHVLLLYVGRLAVEKELGVLVEALRYLGERPYRLLVVGDGPLRQELQQACDERVIFPGYRSGEELRRIYASADIFVFPSSTETYGNVILEAMVSGLPVVAPRAGGVRENLVDDYNGLYFKARDARDMARAIQRLVDAPALRQRLSQGAHQLGQSRSWQEVFRRQFSIYQGLIEYPVLYGDNAASA